MSEFDELEELSVPALWQLIADEIRTAEQFEDRAEDVGDDAAAALLERAESRSQHANDALLVALKRRFPKTFIRADEQPTSRRDGRATLTIPLMLHRLEPRSIDEFVAELPRPTPARRTEAAPARRWRPPAADEAYARRHLATLREMCAARDEAAGGSARGEGDIAAWIRSTREQIRSSLQECADAFERDFFAPDR